jgi:hypothetical protein
MLCSRILEVWHRLLSFLCCLPPQYLHSSKSARIISMPRLRMFRKKYVTRKQRTKLLPQQHGLHLVWARRENSSSLSAGNLHQVLLRKIKPKPACERLAATGTETKEDFSIYLTH